MQRRKVLALGAGAAAAATTLTAPAIAQGLPTIKWRMTSSFPKSTDITYGAGETFAKYVSDLTEGKFTIQQFAAGEIVPGLQALDAVQSGSVDGAYTGLLFYVGKDPTFALGATSAPDTVYTWAFATVYKSTNFGQSWSPMNMTGYNPSNQIRNVTAAAGDPNAVAVVTSGGTGFVTYNGGSSWTQFGSIPNNGLNMSYVWFSTASSSTLYAASVAPTAANSHLWKSTNSGATWTAIDGNGRLLIRQRRRHVFHLFRHRPVRADRNGLGDAGQPVVDNDLASEIGPV